MPEPFIPLGIASLCMSFIGTLVFIASVKNFKKYHTNNFMQIRSIYLIFVTMIPATLHLFILQPICALSFGLNLFKLNVRLFGYLTLITINCVIVCIFTRVWYQFTRLKRATDTAQWKIHLNDGAHETNAKCITKYWRYIGNVKIILTIAITWYFIICIILALCMFIPDNILYGARAMFIAQMILIPTTVSMVIYWLISVIKFKDYWFIAAEYKRYAIICIQMLMIGVAMRVFIGFETEYKLTICIIIMQMGIGYGNIAILLVGLYWIPYKNINAEKLNVLNQIVTSTNSDDHVLFNLLKNEKGYELFMNHLTKEFATETLLFFTQLKQYQDFLVENKVIDERRLLLNDNVILPSNLPNLRHINDKNMTIQQKTISIWWLLYDKYIHPEMSLLTINISYEMIAKLTNSYRRMNIDNAVDYIEEIWNDLVTVGEDVYYLMLQSFARFRTEHSVHSEEIEITDF